MKHKFMQCTHVREMRMCDALHGLRMQKAKPKINIYLYQKTIQHNNNNNKQQRFLDQKRIPMQFFTSKQKNAIYLLHNIIEEQCVFQNLHIMPKPRQSFSIYIQKSDVNLLIYIFVYKLA